MKNKKKSHLRKVIYALIIGFAVVSFWRGVWGLQDLYLFPENLVWSFFASILLGIIILYFTKHLVDRWIN